MGISVKETTVFSVFHPDAHDLFNTCSDLKKVAWELCDPERRLNDQVLHFLFFVYSKLLIASSPQDKTIQLFRAFAPMLCKRPTGIIEEAVKDMEGHTFFLEEKLDGERIQLHKRGNEYFYCSRSVLRLNEPPSFEPVQGKERTIRISTGATSEQAV
jgi:DNA ligase 4